VNLRKFFQDAKSASGSTPAKIDLFHHISPTEMVLTEWAKRDSSLPVVAIPQKETVKEDLLIMGNGGRRRYFPHSGRSSQLD
jgi:hypothetical protein